MAKHNCEDYSIEKVSTKRAPYWFVLSGLPNVYLDGVKYTVCQKCKMQAAELPCLTKLLRAIAIAVADSPKPLTGREIRYLRTSLMQSSRDFAAVVGVTPDQVSRWEKNRNRPEPSADKLIRMLARYGIPEIKPRTSDKIVINVRGLKS